jgi:hypothetical protein
VINLLGWWILAACCVCAGWIAFMYLPQIVFYCRHCIRRRGGRPEPD